MIIYIVAGERNCKAGAVNDNGGLWANVGQTERSPQARLLDDDYRKKAAGGKWLLLAEFDVGDNLTDHDVHKYLKSHPEVRWDSSYNTEEFLFTTDNGTGQKAKEIVRDFIEPFSLSMLQAKVSEMQTVIDQLQVDKIVAETKLNDYLATDEGKVKDEYSRQLEQLEAEYCHRLQDLEDRQEKSSLLLEAEYCSKLQDLEDQRRKVKNILLLRQVQLNAKETRLDNERQTLDNQSKTIAERESRVSKAELEVKQKQRITEEESNRLNLKINWGIAVTLGILLVSTNFCSHYDNKVLRYENLNLEKRNEKFDMIGKDWKQKAEDASARIQKQNELLADKDKDIQKLRDEKNSITCKVEDKSAEHKTEKKPVKIIVKSRPVVTNEPVKVVVTPEPVKQETSEQIYAHRAYHLCMKSCGDMKAQCYQGVQDNGKWCRGFVCETTNYQCSSRTEKCNENCLVQRDHALGK